MSKFGKKIIKSCLEEAEQIEKYGRAARGKQEYLAYLRGEHLSFKKIGLALCYFCMNGYIDGKFDCNCQFCPLHTYMPYVNEEAPKEIKSLRKSD